MGWGSGTTNFPYLITPEMALNNYILSQTNTASVQTICDNYAQSQIQSLATTSTAALVFINAQAGEGFIDVDGNVGDRRNLSAWHDADRLIENVTTYNNNTVCPHSAPEKDYADCSRLSSFMLWALSTLLSGTTTRTSLPFYGPVCLAKRAVMPSSTYFMATTTRVANYLSLLAVTATTMAQMSFTSPTMDNSTPLKMTLRTLVCSLTIVM
jgi:hypothetical protein